MTRGSATEPKWWVQEIVSAGVIALVVATVTGGAFMMIQNHFDERRDLRASRLENLRFVRDRSTEANVERPFQSLDLHEGNLNGLKLAGSDLQNADLSDSQLIQVNLAYSNLARADLSGASIWSANLSHTYLVGTNFSSAVLTGTTLDGVCYDDTTVWPKDFVPPPSRTDACP